MKKESGLTNLDNWKKLLESENVHLPEFQTQSQFSFSEAYENFGDTHFSVEADVIALDLGRDDLGNLSLRGEAAFAYIRRGRGKPNARKVHFTYCKAIMKYPSSKFYCTNRNDHLFEIDLEDRAGNLSETVLLPLVPCEMCIGKYYGIDHDIEGRSEKKHIAANFDYKLISTEIGKTLNSNAWRSTLYKFTNESWSEVSLRVRNDANWTCEKCKIYVGEEYAVFLHAHHKHADRNFNHSSNIAPLCIRCHAEEPGHEGLKNSQYDRFMIGVKSGKFKVE